METLLLGKRLHAVGQLDLAARAEFVGLISAGVVLGWLGSLVPMGLGVSESGSYGVFSLIGAPATVGVSLALAGRVRQIIIAGLGFTQVDPQPEDSDPSERRWETVALDARGDACPKCGGGQLQVNGGTEMRVKDITGSGSSSAKNGID